MKFFKIYTYLTLLLFFSSCSGLGYGIYLWDENGLNTGNVYKIVDSSNLRDTYTIVINKNKEEVPKWKLETFSRKKKALNKAETYKDYNHTFAICSKDRHAIRINPNAFAPQIYTLRDNENLKVITRSEEPVKIGSTENYWYKVLTEDGNIGYSYGHNLLIYNEDDLTKLKTNLLSGYKDLLDKKFYPQEYKEQIDKKIINMDLLALNYHFIIESSSKLVTIKTKELARSWNYTDITKISGDVYSLKNTPIRFEIKDEGSILVTSETMIDFGKNFYDIANLNKIVEQETLKQNKIMEELLSKGRNFYSSGFGKLSIDENKIFTWSDYNKLVPEFLNSTDTNKGRVRNTMILPEELKSSYDGTLTFKFDNGETLWCTYKLIDGSIQLYIIPNYLVENNILVRKPNSPVTIFFKRY